MPDNKGELHETANCKGKNLLTATKRGTRLPGSCLTSRKKKLFR